MTCVILFILRVHPLITSPSLCCISALIAWSITGSPSQKLFSLILPIQAYSRHFNLCSLAHLLVIMLFLSCLTFGTWISMWPLPLESPWSLPWCLLSETPGRAIFPSCSVEHTFFTSCPALTGPNVTAITISCLICSKVCYFSGTHLNGSFSKSLHGECLQSDCSLEYVVTRNPQCL